GVAWNPSMKDSFWGRLLGDRKTVIRGGYGINYPRLTGITNLQPAMKGNASFASPNVNNGPKCNDNGTPGQGCAASNSNNVISAFRVGVDGPARIPLLLPVQPVPFIPGRPFQALSQEGFDPFFKLGYTHSADLSIQRELPGDLILEVGWIGRYGRRQLLWRDPNAIAYFAKDLS